MRRVALVVFVLSGFAASCGSSYSPTPAPTPSPTPSPSSNAIEIPAGAYQGSVAGFAPATLTVPVGTTVTWTNNDVTAHTTTSDNGVWDSGTLNPGASYSFTFMTKGTFGYHCTIHSFMKGTVVVQ